MVIRHSSMHRCFGVGFRYALVAKASSRVARIAARLPFVHVQSCRIGYDCRTFVEISF